LNKINHADVNKSDFWNDRYNSNQDLWDLNGPTPILKKWSLSTNINKPLKICIPGCGKGHDALYLASKGHDVFAIDFSSKAINYIKDKNIYPNLHIIEKDFFNLTEDFYNFFDVIFEYTFFCAINISKRSEYVKMCNKLLKSSGTFLGIIFPINKLNSENSPPFKVDLNKFEDLFSKYFLLNSKEYSDLSIKARKKNEIVYSYIKK